MPGKGKRQRDNRSKQKNPRHNTFWKDRGWDGKPNLPDFVLDAAARQDRRNKQGIV